jgi:glucose/arabinose dehydrogenase
MKRLLRLPGYAFLCGSLAVLAFACGGEDDGDSNGSAFAVKSELVASIGIIDALAFAADGRLFLADHWGGTVRVVSAEGELLPDPVFQFGVAAGPEWGFTGLALDPEFESNHYIYGYFTEFVDQPANIARPIVVRFTEEDNKGSDPQVIVGDLPDTRDKQPFNANGSIHFGPDGLLYLTVGDFDVPQLQGPMGKPSPQDLGTPMGKMLRVNKEDGSAPAENPFVAEPGADPRIFAYGFRENFYFTFRPESGQIYGTDNTSITCEELNVISSGGNYGWPNAGEWPYFDCFAAGDTLAIHFFTANEDLKPGDFGSSVGSRGMAFVSKDVYPLLGDGLLICAGPKMHRVLLSGADFDHVDDDDIVVEDCGRDIAVSPEGIVYYANDTEVRRLTPIPVETQQQE